eukprot:gene20129-26136_t
MSFHMDYTTLGDSDLKISKITLGTMTFGEQNSESDAHEQLSLAFNKYGINTLDTAEIYPVPTKAETQGKTDKYISSWLKTVDRSKVILATKVAGPGVTWLPGRNGQKSRVSKHDILESVDNSLKRLSTDYIDLLQIHWPDRYVPLFGGKAYNISLERESISFEEQLETFNELIKSVRSDYESSLVEVCSPRHENIGLLAYSPLCGGILTNKYSNPENPKNSRFNLFPGYMERYKQSLTLKAVELYSQIAKKYDLTPTELALAWCYKRPHVASTIIGATTIPQLIENIESYNKISLINDDIENEIEQVYKLYKDPTKNM